MPLTVDDSTWKSVDTPAKTKLKTAFKKYQQAKLTSQSAVRQCWQRFVYTNHSQFLYAN